MIKQNVCTRTQEINNPVKETESKDGIKIEVDLERKVDEEDRTDWCIQGKHETIVKRYQPGEYPSLHLYGWGMHQNIQQVKK